VPVVAGVFLHEVLPHPPHRDGLVPERERVVQRRALQRGVDSPAFGPVALEVPRGGGRVCLGEVRVRGIGVVIQVGYLLTAEGLPDPPALGVAQMPDQAEQRGAGRASRGACPVRVRCGAPDSPASARRRVRSRSRRQAMPGFGPDASELSGPRRAACHNSGAHVAGLPALWKAHHWRTPLTRGGWHRWHEPGCPGTGVGSQEKRPRRGSGRAGTHPVASPAPLPENCWHHVNAPRQCPGAGNPADAGDQVWFGLGDETGHDVEWAVASGDLRQPVLDAHGQAIGCGG